MQRMDWMRLLDRSKKPIYLAIADAVERAIGLGELRSGDRLPPHRTLARQLGVDLTTVTKAYAEARRRGLLDATVGRGTFVRSTTSGASMTQEGSYIDMTINLPPPPQGTSLSTVLREGLTSLILGSNLALLMSFRVGAGSPRDREAAAYWLNSVLGRTEFDRLLVCAGAQCAFSAIITLLVRPGATILTDRLTYPNFLSLAAHLSIRLVAVESDEHGMVPEAVEQACKKEKPQAIYCVPTIQNPTTTTMPVQRRQALAATAARHRLLIIEDDAYGMIPSQPLPAIASFAPEFVYYIGTLSKCLSPGFRIAFVVAPGAPQAQRLTTAVRALSLSPTPLFMSLITRWISDGTATTLRENIRRENIARQKIAAEVLPTGSIKAHSEGLHLWLTLPEYWNRFEFIAYMRQQGILLIPSDAFFVSSTPPNAMPPNAVRICLGTSSSQTVLRTALQSIADAMRMKGDHHLSNIV